MAQGKIESGVKKSGCELSGGGGRKLKLLQTWIGGGCKSEDLELELGWCCDEACSGTPMPRRQVDKETLVAVAATVPEMGGCHK